MYSTQAVCAVLCGSPVKDGGRSDDRNLRQRQARDFLPIAKNICLCLSLTHARTHTHKYKCFYTHASANLQAACMQHLWSGVLGFLQMCASLS